MKNILVIGGTGFIGSHLVEKLLYDGYKLAVLVRRNSDIKFIKELSGIKLCQGDLLEPDSLSKALFGIDTVFCMVNVKPAGKTKEEYERQLYLLHTDGTRNLINACKANKVRRLIYLSSVAIIGYKKDIDTYDESSEINPVDVYGKAKFEAERILNVVSKNNEMDITILRPVGVFGERGLGPLKKIIFFVNKGIVLVLGSGKNLQSISYVGNVVNEVIFLAKNNASIGKIYIATDEKPYSVNTLVDAVGRAMGKHYLKAHIPLWLIRCSLWCINFLGKITIKREIINSESIIAITTERIFDGSKIFRELGYRQEYDLATGIRRTLAWHKKRND